MPHRKIRAARKKVEGAQAKRDEKKARIAELKKRGGADVRRARRALARRTVPVEDEARQSKREAVLLARALGAGRVQGAAGSAREHLAGIDLGQIDGGEMGALAQIDAMEREAYGGSDSLGPSVDDVVISGGRSVDRFGGRDLDAHVLGGPDGGDLDDRILDGLD